MNKKIKSALIVLSPIILVILSCFAVRLVATVNYLLHRNDWKELTTPLPNDRIEILCNNFDMEESNGLCNHESDVYGPDFYDAIKAFIKTELKYGETSEDLTSFDQVEKKIGIFRIECGALERFASEDRNYFPCVYDLRGDGVYRVIIKYRYPENTVHSIITPMKADIESP